MENRRETITADLLLLVTAFLWGSSFAVRRIGLFYMPPFFFNSARFLAAFLFMLLCWLIKRRLSDARDLQEPLKKQLRAGLIVGLFYSAASSFQQAALVTMDAGETGFLTSLYILLVPLISWVFLRQEIRRQVWIGACLAVIGLFLISAQDNFHVSAGILYLLLGAVCYALQMIAIGRFVKRADPLFLVVVQLFVGTTANGLLSLFFEERVTMEGTLRGIGPILYAGILSLGIANLLQFIAQKKLTPSAAAILCSFESIFGALTGAVLLKERMGPMQLAGCMLIFFAMMISQYEGRAKYPKG